MPQSQCPPRKDRKSRAHNSVSTFYLSDVLSESFSWSLALREILDAKIKNGILPADTLRKRHAFPFPYKNWV